MDRQFKIYQYSTPNLRVDFYIGEVNEDGTHKKIGGVTPHRPTVEQWLAEIQGAQS